MGSSTGVVLREHWEGVLALMLRTAPLQSLRAPLQSQCCALHCALTHSAPTPHQPGIEPGSHRRRQCILPLDRLSIGPQGQLRPQERRHHAATKQERCRKEAFLGRAEKTGAKTQVDVFGGPRLMTPLRHSTRAHRLRPKTRQSGAHSTGMQPRGRAPGRDRPRRSEAVTRPPRCRRAGA